MSEVLEYVTRNADAWDFEASRAAQVEVGAAEWARDVALLDAAILALLDGETEDDQVENALFVVLEGSLFSRQIAKEEADLQRRLRSFVAAQAQRIWSETVPSQRKGYKRPWKNERPTAFSAIAGREPAIGAAGAG